MILNERSGESLTLIRFSEKGRPFTTESCARRTLAAATSFIASVIFLVFLMESMRSRSSFMPAWQTCRDTNMSAHHALVSHSTITIVANAYLRLSTLITHWAPHTRSARGVEGWCLDRRHTVCFSARCRKEVVLTAADVQEGYRRQSPSAPCSVVLRCWQRLAHAFADDKRLACRDGG